MGNEEALFLRRIADFWQEGEYKIAKTQIEEFIAEYPESPFSDALCAALGDLFLREKNFASALQYYSQVQSPEFQERVLNNRMQCLYEMQWYATLAEECEATLKTKDDLHVTYFLALALYHQCLNSGSEPDTLLKFAKKALPHFEMLAQSELFEETAQGFAHLCCMIKDYEKAAEIYLKLSDKNPDSQEEMLFQLALIQSEYNKEKAIQTFDKIVKLDRKKAQEALFNRLVLAFEMGHFGEVTSVDLTRLPVEKMSLAHLFLARSYLQMKKFPESVNELKKYFACDKKENEHTAYLTLLDAAYQSDDLSCFDEALLNFSKAYPEDVELAKAYFSKAQILKKKQNFSEAENILQELLVKFPACEQKAQILFEIAHLNYKMSNWSNCYQKAIAFVEEFPEHELSSFAWRYLLGASSEIAAKDDAHKELLLLHLESFLTKPLAYLEKNEWKLLLAKTYYELHRYEEALMSLEDLELPNAYLLAALCYRDGLGNKELFCQKGELALAEGATWLDTKEFHLALFNAYLELSQKEKGIEHLYQAFRMGAEIKKENLLWLAQNTYQSWEEEEKNFALAARSASILEAALKLENNPALCYQLATLYCALGKLESAIALLENSTQVNQETDLLLADLYAKKGIIDKACQLFDSIVKGSATLRNKTAAQAALRGAQLKLQMQAPDVAQIATQLKNLCLQKTFEAEPSYLEAALEYVTLLSHSDLNKKISLLNKTKSDFERTDDLLSKDYHAARTKFPKKDKMYQGYMQLIDAEILAAEAKLDSDHQKDLQAKSKSLLLQIINEQSATTLLDRANTLLANEFKE